jgi:hypothetical protein
MQEVCGVWTGCERGGARVAKGGVGEGVAERVKGEDG